MSSMIRTHARAVGLIQEKWLATLPFLASLLVAMIMMAEPVLFGRTVEALSKGASATHLDGTRGPERDKEPSTDAELAA